MKKENCIEGFILLPFIGEEETRLLPYEDKLDLGELDLGEYLERKENNKTWKKFKRSSWFCFIL